MRKVTIIWILFFITFQGLEAQLDPDIRRLRGVNTGFQEEHAPFIMGDTMLYYMATGSRFSWKKVHDQNRREFFNLYMALREGSDSRFKNPKQLVMTPRSENGSCTPSLAKDGSMMVFSKFVDYGRESEDRSLKSGLFFADRSGDRWINVRHFEYNDPEHNLLSPFISEGGDTLFFSANYDDAIGSYDIYVSYFYNNEWTEPKNLGRSINSEATELYPFYHPIGRLYFSSDGFDNNRQGFDIFQSEYYDEKWQPAEKIIYQKINTASDEYAFSISGNFRSGLFVRRAGTYDIFEFKYDVPEFPDPPVSKSNYNRRFLLKDNSLVNDTIDPELFEVAWVINDTLKIYEIETIYAFPGPGTYNVRFEVFDKLLDSTRIIVNRDLEIPVRKQAAIICPDTVMVNQEFSLDGSETYFPELGLERKEDLRDFTFYWDFGGEFDSEITTRHTYRKAGKYTIILGVEQQNVGRNEEPEIRYNSKTIVVLEPE